MAVSGELRAWSEAVRKSCHPRAWSRGVLLAREGAVEGKEASEEEIVLAVRVPERPVPLTVVFYPETREVDCECGAEACAHAAAAIIALVQAREAGASLPGGSSRLERIRYRFRRAGGKLVLERLLGGEVLSGAVARMASRVSLTQNDLDLEPLLPGGVTEVTEPEQQRKLLGLLEEVLLDERSVRVSRLELRPRGRVEGDAARAIFTITADPELEEIIGDGLGRTATELRPLGETILAGLRWEKLPLRRTFERAEFATLVAEVLPLYRPRIELTVENEYLPELGRPVSPAIDFHLSYERDAVAVAPELVYGSPARLRIEENRPIYLGGEVPPRDLAAERKLIERLRGELNLVTGRRVVVKGSEAPNFLLKVREFQGQDDLIPKLIPRLEILDDRLVLDFEARSDVDEEAAPAGRAEAVQVLRAFEAGHSLVPLLDGGWAEIPRDFLSQHADRIARLLLLRDPENRVPKMALPELARLAEDLNYPVPKSLDLLTPLFREFRGLPAATLPEDLQATLRPYQKTGVDWLCFLRDAELGAILADDMGLGKTLQALCALRGRTLIIAPTSVLPNWRSEIERFRPSLAINLYHGPGRALAETADITLTTYAILRLDAEKLTGVRWDTVILDEAQAIKNAESQTARAAYGLQSKWRVALTGTPIENRLEELWSQVHFTNPGLLHGRAEFTARFAKPISEGDPQTAKRLRELIRPFVLRRLKRDVARDLPPRTDMVLFAELDDNERAIYDAIRLATKREVVARLAEGKATVLEALEALLRLRQAACHSALVPGQTAETSSKLDTLIESLGEVIAEGHKALVFSQWTSLLDLLQPHLEKAGLAYARLDGSTRDRGEVVANFQNPDGPPVLIISLKAGGTGLNLTAADHVFLLDPWWNPAVEDQAADRAHRIGQDRPVMVYRLVAKDTVEERILALQARKRAIAETALGEAAAAAALTKEDLLALLD